MNNLLDYIKALSYGFRIVNQKYRDYFNVKGEIEVETSYGLIKGVKRVTIYDDEYFSFEGIPFAKPPIGEWRFHAPELPEAWTGVKDCTKVSSIPMQANIMLGFTEGSEDCLYLNVYSKDLHPKSPLPVMVWLYGGGFENGGNDKILYGPEYLLKENVVLITINYRVGAFGFLSLSDSSINIPGNAGLKDQIMGLKWVKSNCANFGGDPNNITLFGESAGGTSAHFLAISDQAKDLFHKAILMSGTAYAQWSITNPHNLAYRLAVNAGYKGNCNEKMVVEFLKQLKAAAIVKATKGLLSPEDDRNRILFAFTPVIEPYVADGCVLAKQPRELMKNAWGNKIPMMIGGNSFEGLLFYKSTRKSPEIFQQLENFEYIVPLEVEPNRKSENCRKLGLKLKEAHFGEKEVTIENFINYLDLLSYKYFWHPICRAVEARLAYTSSPTYLYRFDFDSAFFNHYRIMTNGKDVRGTGHADDLSYLFSNIVAVKLDVNSSEYLTIRRMVEIWTTFAETGNPNPNSIKPVIFHPLEKDDTKFKCLNISENLEFIELPELEKIKAWNDLYPKELLF